MLVLIALLGSLTWLLAEYLLHRFVGHGRGRSLFAREHRTHHAVGDYFAPTWKKALNMGPVLLAMGAGGTYVWGTFGIVYAAGLATAYVGYEIFHRRLHTHPPRGRFGRWARRHHFFHHFGDPSKNHGVTTPIFDKLFRSEVVPEEPIHVPAKLAMCWLMDPSNRSVRSEHVRDYEIREAAGPLRFRTVTIEGDRNEGAADSNEARRVSTL